MAFSAARFSVVISLALSALSVSIVWDMQHLKVREFEIRTKYPEYFARSIPASAADGLAKRYCGFVEPAQNKTENTQVLSAREMKWFLMGRGSFITPKGTRYADPYFEAENAKGSLEVESMTEHPNYLVVKAANGKNVLQPLLEHRREAQLMSAPQDLIPFGPLTALRWMDLPGLESELLADPEFDSVEFFGIRWDRRFLEATKEYEAAGLD